MHSKQEIHYTDRSTGVAHYLYNLLNEPGHRLQVVTSDALSQCLLQCPIVRLGQLHTRKQVRYDTGKQRDVVRQELYIVTCNIITL